ncbi:MAG: hypothetical protein J0J15_30830, partial [Mesorhizobium sp.]|nr:hypothetical protein [Mesorhizobium sp.]
MGRPKGDSHQATGRIDRHSRRFRSTPQADDGVRLNLKVDAVQQAFGVTIGSDLLESPDKLA